MDSAGSSGRSTPSDPSRVVQPWLHNTFQHSASTTPALYMRTSWRPTEAHDDVLTRAPRGPASARPKELPARKGCKQNNQNNNHTSPDLHRAAERNTGSRKHALLACTTMVGRTDCTRDAAHAHARTGQHNSHNHRLPQAPTTRHTQALSAHHARPRRPPASLHGCPTHPTPLATQTHRERPRPRARSTSPRTPYERTRTEAHERRHGPTGSDARPPTLAARPPRGTSPRRPTTTPPNTPPAASP